jgi:predicted nucleic acid-binding protein
LTVEELQRYQDPNALDTMSIKIKSYNLLKHQAPLGEEILKVSKNIDNQDNDINDTQILNEIYEGRVDILISEDKKIHTKASLLGIADKVYKIQNFLEKVTSENPELVDYKVLSVQKVDFAEVNLRDAFFDSFREDYAEFDKWFNKKADDICYVWYNKKRRHGALNYKTIEEFNNQNNIYKNVA